MKGQSVWIIVNLSNRIMSDFLYNIFISEETN